jgi:signal transduction histidine kinase
VPTVRISVLPKAVASEVVTDAVSRAAWAVSIVVMLLDIPIVIDMVSRRSGSIHVVLPLLAVLGMIGLLVYTGLRPGLRSRIVMLSVGAVLSITYQSSILLVDAALMSDGAYLINRIAFILVLVSPGIVRPLEGLRWAVIGYVVSMASLLIGDTIAGVPLVTGWGPTIALLAYSCAYLVLAVLGLRDTRLPDLQRLERETHRLDIEHEYELRAAALIHDTVLNDLTVVMNSDGTLDGRTRERFRADVATLSDAAWLRETRDSVELAQSDAALRNQLLELITEMQWRGLTVDLTGGTDEEIARLSSENVATATAAVRACLENVLQHAKVDSVELVLSAGAGAVTIMVIDQGAGFDLDAVPDDRLGLRTSVVRRVEAAGGSVRVWSKPGSGTSVLITLPSEDEGAEVDE